jgi:uncharacterized protein YjbI with pentapeptide repeats
MANAEYLELLRQGVRGWNQCRISRAELHRADLSGADLRGLDLTGVNLAETYLDGANLSGATLSKADLSDADLRKARLCGAHLNEANLRGAILSGAKLCGANLREANLRGSFLDGANLSKASLHGAILTDADLTEADLSGCYVYGISAWNVTLNEGTKQQDLVVTPQGESELTTDDLEVAQFIYLMLDNEKLQRVIDTITSKVVLILGRFSPERKMVLDALRDELRTRNYVPVVFDFEKPRSGTTINTVTLLARMARFVIADVSDAKSVLMELQAIVPSSPKLPVLPIIVAGQNEPGMFDSFEAYPWFLKVHPYENPAQLLVDLKDRVIGPLEAEVAKLRRLP